MLRFFAVAAGGALGALSRYIIGGIDFRLPHTIFPTATLVVNITGSLLIGILWGIFDRFAISPNMRLFLFIGVLGGYTTFSTFSLETFNLIRESEYLIAAINVALSVILSLIAVFAGYFISKTLIGLFK